MFERFTERARKVVVLAQEEARTFNHNYIGTEHLLLGLLREDEGVAARALGSLNVHLDEVREQVENIVGYGEEGTGGQAPFTPRSKKVLELALREALQLGHNYIGTEHILLGLVRESEGVAARVLSNLDVDPDKVRREVVRMLGGGPGAAGPGRRGRRWPRRDRSRGQATQDAAVGSVRSQPHHVCRRRQARSGNRAQPGDRAHHADPRGGGPRTTRSLSESRASVRPLSWRAWPRRSPRTGSRTSSRAKKSIRWISGLSWPVPSTGASSRSA